MDIHGGKAFAPILLGLLAVTVSVNVGLVQGSSLLLDEGKAEPSSGPGASVETFPLPPGYNKLLIPAVNGSIVFLSMHLFILKISKVDETNGLLELDTEFGFSWSDWHIWKHLIENPEVQKRLLNASPDGFFGADAQFLHSIWRPDVSIMELASVDTTYLLAKQMAFSIRVKEPETFGKIELVTRQTLRVRCDMDFTYYPADTQKCGFNLLSWSYGTDEFLLGWSKEQRVYLDETTDPNYDFQVSDVEPGDKFHDYYTTYQQPRGISMNFSALTFSIHIRRNLAYHAVQTFLPSILLIMITWLCFLLPPDKVDARIGISMTTLLTIIAMFAAVRQQAPRVSYVMAIDAWMIFCILIIFLALALFTVMYWLRQQFKTTPEDASDVEAQATKDAEGEILSEEIEPKRESKSTKIPAHKYLVLVTYSKRYAFTSFAVVFIVFLGIYASWLITASDYHSWNPSPTYNALKLDERSDESSSNRIFAYHGTPYPPDPEFSRRPTNGLNGTFLASEQFEDVVNGVICPRVLDSRPNTSCTYENYEKQ